MPISFKDPSIMLPCNTYFIKIVSAIRHWKRKTTRSVGSSNGWILVNILNWTSIIFKDYIKYCLMNPKEIR
jgi:hypothetical protein